jgi:hypothetical protein
MTLKELDEEALDVTLHVKSDLDTSGRHDL